MTPETKNRVDRIRRGEVPKGYRKTKAGILPTNWDTYILGDCLRRIERPVEVNPNKFYTQIGIRSHGKGLFYKEPVTGTMLGKKSVFWIEPDCLLSPEMVSALSQGLLSSATYDAIKMLLAFIRNKFYHHPICKIQGGKVTEETANIHFVVGNNLLVLPIDIDDEKYQYTVDKFMELAASTLPERPIYSFYSEEMDQFVQKTQEEIIKSKYERWKKDKPHS